MVVRNAFRIIPMLAIFLITITINPAITGHAEEKFVQDIATVQSCTNVFHLFNTTTPLGALLFLLFWFCVGVVIGFVIGWLHEWWKETHQGNETLLC